MPLRHTDQGWFWGSKGPFASKAKAQQVARAAYANGYSEESTMSEYSAGKFVGNLMHSSTVTHFMHLQAAGEGSYAKHKALQEYYEGIIELADTVAEAIQGCYGELITDYPTTFTVPSTDALEYMLMIKDYVAEGRKTMPQESNIQNEIDNIATLIDSTLYKLTFLR